MRQASSSRIRILTVEVLSESTAAFDRGDKFAAYRSLPSLQEYVLVDVQARRVEMFRRKVDQDWLLHEHLPDRGDCLFPALEVSVPFDEIFENVDAQ
jgi:Uma2 family endonuclease